MFYRIKKVYPETSRSIEVKYIERYGYRKVKSWLIEFEQGDIPNIVVT